MGFTGPRNPLVLAALAVLAAGAVAQEALNPADEVLDRHLAAFAARDLDALMADYTKDSVMIIPDGVLRGPAEIRPLFADLVEEFSAPEAALELHARHVDGRVAYTLWSAETPQRVYSFATDTLYVESGKILYQTFAAEAEARD